jgi:predicted amidohydrolase
MRAAIVQTCSTDDLKANLERAAAGIREAAGRGAELVALPENFAYMRREGAPLPSSSNSSRGDGVVQNGDGVIVRFLREAAAEAGVWLLGGTFPEAAPDGKRVYNTSVVVGPDGVEVARYRKIHLFDVDLGEAGEDSYRESDHFAPGHEVVVADTAFGPVGLSICYDLRFPELYRAHADRGARFLAVPSAFTPRTGKDHWEVLLRARAIEGQAFVLAAAQCGRHSPDRASHGHSMIVDPWGIVVAQAGDRPAVIEAECDLDDLARIREAIPSLANRRLGMAASE